MINREKIIINLVKNKDVLDIGNSWGELKDLIKSNCKSYKGLDIEKGTDYCKDLNENFDLNKKFDIIIAGEVIEHIENTKIFINNMKKHIKKDGKLFISTPNPTSFRFFLNALLDKEPSYGGHIKYFTKDCLILLLIKHFKHIKIDFTINTLPKPKNDYFFKLKYCIEYIIGSIIKRLSPNIYVICRV